MAHVLIDVPWEHTKNKTVDAYPAMVHAFHALDLVGKIAYLVLLEHVFMTTVVKAVLWHIIMKACLVSVTSAMRDAALARDHWHLIACLVQKPICI